MKYIKLVNIISNCSEPIAEVISVGLDQVIPAYISGTLVDGTHVKESANGFTVNLRSPDRSEQLQPGVIYKLYILDLGIGSNGFQFVYDEPNRRRIWLGSLDAKSMPELVLKLSIRDMVYSDDGETFDIPEAVRQLELARDECAAKDEKLSQLRRDLEAAERAAEAAEAKRHKAVAELSRIRAAEAAKEDGKRDGRAKKTGIRRILSSVFGIGS